MYMSNYGDVARVPHDVRFKETSQGPGGPSKFGTKKKKDDKALRDQQVDHWIKQFELRRKAETAGKRHSEKVDDEFLTTAFESVAAPKSEEYTEGASLLKLCKSRDAITVLRACGCGMLEKEERELLEDFGDQCSFLELKNVLGQKSKTFLEASWQEAAVARGLEGFDHTSRFDQFREAFAMVMDSFGQVDDVTGEEMQAFLNSVGEPNVETLEEVFGSIDKNIDWKHMPLDPSVMLNLMGKQFAKVNRPTPEWVPSDTKEAFMREIKRKRRRAAKEHSDDDTDDTEVDGESSSGGSLEQEALELIAKGEAQKKAAKGQTPVSKEANVRPSEVPNWPPQSPASPKAGAPASPKAGAPASPKAAAPAATPKAAATPASPAAKAAAPVAAAPVAATADDKKDKKDKKERKSISKEAKDEKKEKKAEKKDKKEEKKKK